MGKEWLQQGAGCVPSREVTEFQVREAFCILYITRVNCNIAGEAREEQQNVTARARGKK